MPGGGCWNRCWPSRNDQAGRGRRTHAKWSTPSITAGPPAAPGGCCPTTSPPGRRSIVISSAGATTVGCDRSVKSCCENRLTCHWPRPIGNNGRQTSQRGQAVRIAAAIRPRAPHYEPGESTGVGCVVTHLCRNEAFGLYGKTCSSLLGGSLRSTASHPD